MRAEASMRNRLSALAASALMLGFLSACAVTGVGVEGSVGYDGGYYEPYGYDYGGWGGGYRVGPGRCCDYRDHRDDRHDRPVDRGHPVDRGRGRAPAYHPGPSGRPAPSIPGRPRGR